MSRKLTIKIPVIVGSNGKWCANGVDGCLDPDWGFMAENLDGSLPSDKEPKWPAVERRYMVTATIEVPDEDAADVAADAVAEAT